MSLLAPGDRFPALTVARAGGGTINLPRDLAGEYAVVLLFRGAWCPYCNGQLRVFQRALDRFTEAGIRVVAISADDEATTKELAAKHGLEFPLGHSANVRAVASAVGAFVNDDPLFLQSTGFVLAPDGRVLVSVYSSGAIGRLLPDDVLGLVNYTRREEAASAAK